MSFLITKMKKYFMDMKIVDTMAFRLDAESCMLDIQLSITRVISLSLRSHSSYHDVLLLIASLKAGYFK